MKIFRFRYFFIIIMAWLILSPIHAAVTFQFNYTDAAGVGFNDATYGATRKTTLEYVANTVIGSQLNYNVTVQVDVDSISTGTGYLAAAGQYYGLTDNSIQNGLLYTHILSGVDPSVSNPDATVTVNFGYSWNYTTNAPSGSYSFQSVLFHELTHALGFSSLINSNGTGLSNQSTYGLFDTFLVNSLGNNLVSSGAVFNTALLSSLTSGVYFSGTNANAANGGNPVALYTPSTWSDGSSISHLAGTFTNDLMLYSIASGDDRLSWSSIDIAILEDLGYDIIAIPEAPSVWLLSLGLTIFALSSVSRKRPALCE